MKDKIRVNAQSDGGTWCRGYIVGYAPRYEGRIDAIILADGTKNSDGTWSACKPWLISEWIDNVIIV